MVEANLALTRPFGAPSPRTGEGEATTLTGGDLCCTIAIGGSEAEPPYT